MTSTMKNLGLLGWMALGVAALSCGGSVTTGGGGSSSSSTSTSSSTSGTTSSSSSTSSSGAGGGGPQLDCPASQPSGACPKEGVTCSYGTEVPIACRTVVSCTNGSWLPQPGPICDPTKCPAQAPASMSPCTGEGLQCGWGDGTICQCTKCPGGGGFCMPQPNPVWDCGGPPQTAGCPAIPPNEGTACTQDMLGCFYSPQCIAPEVQCLKGVWTWQQIACGG